MHSKAEDGRLDLVQGTEMKNKEKIKAKPNSSEESVWAIVREGSQGERSETKGKGVKICETGRF